ncbi:MAG: hypothetical protein KF787_04400 [Phycisphaeraceae bacterium]|nr:hypothetical protein [Phycisphaeraceae bacterium]
MSQPALELLRTIGLLDSNDRVADLSRYSESDLAKHVAYYVAHRRKQARSELEGMPKTAGLSSLVSSFSGRTAVQPLLPSTLVFERVIVDDLVFKLHQEENSLSKAGRASLGFSADNTGIEHWRLQNALAFFEHLAPLMRHGIVHCLPLADLHSPPAQPLIKFSPDWYRSDVPDAVHDFVHNSVRLSAVRPGPDGRGLVVFEGAPTSPTRGIMVEFDDDLIPSSAFYLLYEMTEVKRGDENTFTFLQTLPWDKPPDQAYYNAWVYQSINQTIAARLRAIGAEMAVADAAGAAYTTESSFEAHLCAKLGVKGGGAAPSADAVNFLRANEPTLRIDSADTVLRLRTDDPKMFEQFHQTLVEVSRQLHGVDDFDTRAKALLTKEILPQVKSIETAAAKLWGSAAGGVVLAGGTLGLALLSGPVLPLAAVLGVGATLAAGAALPSVTEYLSVRKTPAFLWKQIKKANP